MKWLDEVRIITDKYEEYGVKKGDVGTIIFAWIRDYKYEVVFSDETGWDYAEIMIDVWDLELVRDIGLTDESILKDLPGHNPNWWCKVENGYI